MSDTFFICPHCGSIEGQPEVQWTCAEGHVLTRVSGVNGRTKINHNGDIMLVGQLAEGTEKTVGSPPYAKNPNIAHLFDKFGSFLLSRCPICEAELRATLCQCERCHKVMRPERVGIVHTFTPPAGLAAANLALQRERPVIGDLATRWVA